MCVQVIWGQHLMLRAARVSMANMRTKPLHSIIGLLAFGLLAQCGCGLADISLALRNGGRGRQAYLPPSAPTEHGTFAHHQQQQHRSSNHGQTRYEIYEIHNHYVTPKAQPHHAAPDYLPPQREIVIHHIHSSPSGATTSSHDDNLDVSFLSFAAADVPIAAPLQAPSPANTALSVPFASNYQHDFHQPGEARQPKEQLGGNGEGASEYIPPHIASPAVEHHYRQPLQHVQHAAAAAVPAIPHSNYRGPDYLPPHREHHQPAQPQQGHHQQTQHQQGQTQQGHGGNRAPGYLPPHRGQLSAAVGPGSGSEQYASAHSTTFSQQPFNRAPDYLPPHAANAHVQQHIQTHSQSQQFQAPQYLPPQHVAAQQSQSQPQPHQQQRTVYKGPDYLPPYSAPPASGPEGASPPAAVNEYAAPDYLPPGYDTLGPQQAQNLPEPAHAFQHSLPEAAPQNVALEQDLRTPLPPGYDFSKPANAEEAIAELHTLPQEQPEVEYRHEQARPGVQSQEVVAVGGQAQEAADLVYGQQGARTAESAGFEGPNYLPPHRGSQSSGQEHVRGEYQDHSSALHSLSSYMTTVPPNVRYGDAHFTQPRRPFAKYGPVEGAAPPPRPVVDVAPMYREQSTRPQHYAPAMSYATTTLAIPRPRSMLSAEVRQSLQAFMPKDEQAQIAATASAKIRTVQIFNPDRVTTLKVLETLDAAGVKTIKILGPSHESPTGEHHVVKLVSAASAQEHVQTLKIFDDQQDVPAPPGQSYLPPAATTSEGYRRQR